MAALTEEEQAMSKVGGFATCCSSLVEASVWLCLPGLDFVGDGRPSCCFEQTAVPCRRCRRPSGLGWKLGTWMTAMQTSGSPTGAHTSPVLTLRGLACAAARSQLRRRRCLLALLATCSPWRRLEPNQACPAEVLHALGVRAWALDAGLYESGGDPRLASIRRARGYNYEDCITITPDALPNYEEKIKSFFQEHLHTDEEIRYVLDGSGGWRCAEGGGDVGMGESLKWWGILDVRGQYRRARYSDECGRVMRRQSLCARPPSHRLL